MSLPNEWIPVDITFDNEENAKLLRAERDRLHPNIWEEGPTDERWIGDLAELVFKNWLKHQKVHDCTWIREGAVGKPDFITAQDIRIDVKAVKRKKTPMARYTAQITAGHEKKPVDHFFFMSYTISERKMWLLGGIDRETFLKKSEFKKAGESVHGSYKVRGHNIYNVGIKYLIPPDAWLQEVVLMQSRPLAVDPAPIAY